MARSVQHSLQQILTACLQPVSRTCKTRGTAPKRPHGCLPLLCSHKLRLHDGWLETLSSLTDFLRHPIITNKNWTAEKSFCAEWAEINQSSWNFKHHLIHSKQAESSVIFSAKRRRLRTFILNRSVFSLEKQDSAILGKKRHKTNCCRPIKPLQNTFVHSCGVAAFLLLSLKLFLFGHYRYDVEKRAHSRCLWLWIYSQLLLSESLNQKEI